MKKILMTLIVSIAFMGSMMAQIWNPLGLESHWPDFDYHAYMDSKGIVVAFQIDGNDITVEDYEFDYFESLEMAAFVEIDGEEQCRGNLMFLYPGYVEDYGDPYPTVDGNAVYYTTPGEPLYFKLYDHQNGILYTDYTISWNGEPYEEVMVTGEWYDQGWEDPEHPLIINFVSPVSISAIANPEEGGTVTGSGIYFEGDVCTLSASANPGYYFLNWTENGEVVSSDAEYSFIVTESRDLVANFYTNHWTTEDYQNSMFMIGVVQIDGVEQASPALELGAFCNGECRGTGFPEYDEGRWLYFMDIRGNDGDSITFRIYDHTLQQEANVYCFSEFPFMHYGLIGMEEPYEVLFAKMFVVSVIVNPEDAGIVTGAGNYINGTEVTLTASAFPNSSFNYWTIGDEQVSTDTVYSFIVDEDITIVANFLPHYEVTVSASPMEGGFISGAGIFVHGTSCTLIATAYDGYAFVNWSIDDEIVSTEPFYTFTVTAPVNITANFSAVYPVSVTISPENAGITSGEGEYLVGTEVTLTATANEGYLFNSWTLDGEIVSTEPSYSFTVTVPVSFTANFDVLYSVSISLNLEDAGIVSGEGEYLLGENVTLTATPNEGYTFNNWTLDGEIVSMEPTYIFTVTGSVDLMANFNIVRTQQLAQGWNWWSANLEITLDDLKAALVEALPGSAITIQSQTLNTSYNPDNNRWSGRLNSLEVAYMYKILVAAECGISLEGMPVNSSEHFVILPNGATWIGFPLCESMSVNEALAGFSSISGDKIQSQINNCVYIRGAWRGAVDTLYPGQGYIFWSNSLDNRTLIFPPSTR